MKYFKILKSKLKIICIRRCYFQISSEGKKYMGYPSKSILYGGGILKRGNLYHFFVVFKKGPKIII
jgi:hypothetical protein